MGEKTKVEWCDHTFNGVRGCSKRRTPRVIGDPSGGFHPSGCDGCYAEAMSLRNPKLLGVWGETGRRVLALPAYWQEPHRWNEDACKAGRRARVFAYSLGDVYEDPVEELHEFCAAHGSEPSVEDLRRAEENLGVCVEGRRKLFELIEQTPWLDWLMLTKRTENILDMAPRSWVEPPCRRCGHTIDAHTARECTKCSCTMLSYLSTDRVGWPQNAWQGTSISTQRDADERIPLLTQVPASVRFLSMEPLLEPIDFYLPKPDDTGPALGLLSCPFCKGDGYGETGSLDVASNPITKTCRRCAGSGFGIDWLILGGESGPRARVCDLAWLRRIIKLQLLPVFVKQLGALASDPPNGLAGKRLPIAREALPLLKTRLTHPKGGDVDEWPVDLLVREFPTPRAA